MNKSITSINIELDKIKGICQRKEVIIQKLQKSCGELQRKLNNNDTALFTRLKNDCENKSKTINELKQQLDESQAALAVLEVETKVRIHSLEKENQELKLNGVSLAAYDKVLQEKEELTERTIEDWNKELDPLINEGKTEIERLNKHIAALTEENAVLKSNSDSKSDVNKVSYVELKAKLKKKNALIRAYRNKLRDFEENEYQTDPDEADGTPSDESNADDTNMVDTQELDDVSVSDSDSDYSPSKEANKMNVDEEEEDQMEDEEAEEEEPDED